LISLLGEESGWAEYTRQAENFNASRTMTDGSDNIFGRSVDQIEVHARQLEHALADQDVPPNLHSLDAGMMIQRQEEMRARLEPDLLSFNNMLARVRQATHDYLVATEAELDSGQEQSNFFDQVYMRINSPLTRCAPETAKNLSPRKTVSRRATLRTLATR